MRDSEVTIVARVGLAASLLAGCGASVPRFQDITDSRETGVIIDNIVTQANCEIQSAVQMLILDDSDLTTDHPARTLEWLDSWVADVVLTITIDEKSNINPGLTTNAIIESQSNSFANIHQIRRLGVCLRGHKQARVVRDLEWAEAGL